MLTQERLKEVLNYDPETGLFTRKIKTSNKIRVGDIAGYVHSSGYSLISVDNKEYYSHRLAFLYMEEYSPEHFVDHINGIRDDNRWCNLRHVTQSCNMQNTKVNKSSTTGYTGVTRNKRDNKWHAQIMIGGKTKSLGNHETKLDAALARIAAEDCIPGWHCDERCENRKKVFSDLHAYVLTFQ